MAAIKNERLTVEEIRAAVTYDPESGLFTSARHLRHVGHVNSNGYVIVVVKGVNFRANRLAWAYMTGEWPEHQVDHVNGVRHDNRWSNLREATNSENQQNSKLRSDNKCGVKGVYWLAREKLWRAVIHLNGKDTRLGRFKTLEEATAAITAARTRIHGEFANHGQPVESA